MDAPSPPPPPRPSPQPTSLDGLPDDVQHLILSRIPCRVDRGRMSLVCRTWRTMMALLLRPEELPREAMANILRRRSEEFRLGPDDVDFLLKPTSDFLLRQAMPKLLRPRALPWLLLPAAFPDGSTRVACVLSGCRVHHYLTITPPGARCFGSHDGAWLFLHHRSICPRGNLAFNVRDRRVEKLPYVVHRGATGFYNVLVLAAALSASPDHFSCVGATIGVVPSLQDHAPNAVPLRCRRVAFWRTGMEYADVQMPPEEHNVALQAEDVVYHHGAFHMLTQGNHIRVCEPTEEHRNDVSVRVNWRTRRFQFLHKDIDNQFVRARYLVVSRGELLLVLRFTPQPNQPTSMFKVFREADADADASAWIELDTLDGRMLFVGHGCSRSYEANWYPGLKDVIYFLDDGDFYDAQGAFGVGNARRYPCSDNGKWSEGQVKRCFPRSDPSDQSAPVWLLP